MIIKQVEKIIFFVILLMLVSKGYLLMAFKWVWAVLMFRYIRHVGYQLYINN